MKPSGTNSKPRTGTAPKRGDRVRPVWKENRTGAITDIEYFELID